MDQARVKPPIPAQISTTLQAGCHQLTNSINATNASINGDLHLNSNTSGSKPAYLPAFFKRSAPAGAGHHQMSGGINLKPAFIP